MGIADGRRWEIMMWRGAGGRWAGGIASFIYRDGVEGALAVW